MVTTGIPKERIRRSTICPRDCPRRKRIQPRRSHRSISQVDPYRLDTPSGHRDGKWAAAQLKRAIGEERRTHWRGLHYAIIARGNIRKPNGEIYQNTDTDWKWLSEIAGKAARWLGYIPFERITDNRNAEPIIHRKARVAPEARCRSELDVEIPDSMTSNLSQARADSHQGKPSSSSSSVRRVRSRKCCCRWPDTTRPTSTFRAARSVTRCCTG